MAPGRNEPCPCGSGRKFKQCCGDSRAPSSATPTRADRDMAWDLLDRVSCLPRFQDDVELGFILIWGEEYDDDPGVGTLMDTVAGDLFYEWLWLDHQLHNGQTIAEHAIEKHAREVGPGSRQFLRACVDAPLRLLQVDRVEIGERVHVRDVLRRGPTIAVTERQGSKELARHDVLTTRIAKYGDEAQFEGMNIRFGVDDKKALAASIRRLQRLLTEEMPAGAVRERLLRMAAGAAIVRATVRLFDRPMPQLRTSDGDELAFADVLFTVIDDTAVRAALDAMPDLEREDADTGGHGVTRYAWMATADPTRRDGRLVLGSVAVEGSLIRIETMSMGRARLAKDLFGVSIPAAAIRFKGIQVKSVQSAIEAARAHPDFAQATDSADIPELVAAQRELMERHYREWLDVPVPALGNRTPREAAKVKHLQARLRDLVDSIENQAEHEARNGRGFDVAFMRKELGLR